MKIRNGFVSNSSSSSFVLAIRKSESCPHCGRKDLDILKLIEESGSYDEESCIKSQGHKSVLKKLEERCKEWYDDNVEEKLENYRKEIAKYPAKDGWDIAIVDISYISLANEVLKQAVQSGSIVQISKD